MCCFFDSKTLLMLACKAIGYLGDLVAKGIPDPIKYAQDMVDGLNEGIPNKKEQKIGDASL